MMLIPGHRTPPTTATAHSFLISEASTLALVKPRLAADSGPVRFYPIRTPLSSLLRSLPRSGPVPPEPRAHTHVRTQQYVQHRRAHVSWVSAGVRGRPAGVTFAPSPSVLPFRCADRQGLVFLSPFGVISRRNERHRAAAVPIRVGSWMGIHGSLYIRRPPAPAPTSAIAPGRSSEPARNAAGPGRARRAVVSAAGPAPRQPGHVCLLCSRFSTSRLSNQGGNKLLGKRR